MQGPWSDGVPTGWQIRPLWSEFRRGKTLGDGSEELLSVYRDYGVIPKSSREDNFNKPSEDLSKYQRVSVGDLVVNKMKAWQGSLGISNHDGIVSPAYFVYKATGTFEPRFAHYLLRSKEYADHMAAISSGIRPNQWDLDPAQFAVTPLLVPPPAEQRAIADYLDRETAQIDAFIAKNEELITLLTERRIAASARTVTGRRSGEADQDSNWMHGLPSEWKLLPVKLLAKRVTDGAHISPETEGGEYDFVSTRDVSAGSIDFEGSLKTSPETYSYMVRTGCQPKVGDVLYSKDGTIGETAVVRESRDFVVASSLIIITPDPSLVVSDYLRYALSSVPLLEQAKTLVRGAGLPRLSIANLATVRVPLPPLEVQRELVGWLDQVTRSIDSAVGIARRSVALARERRAALISAAVTGKIDVGVAA